MNNIKNDDLDIYVDNFVSLIHDTSKSCIPHRSVLINNRDCRWITSCIKKRIRQRQRAYRKAKRTGSEYHWSKFRRIRNDIDSRIRKAKSEYIDKY